MRIIKATFFFLLVIASISVAKQLYTPLSLYGGASVNGVFYVSDFRGIPGTQSCCPKYESAFGVGYGFYLGGRYGIDRRFAGFSVKPYAAIAYNDLSATFSEEEKIGNAIYEDYYVDAVSEHRIEVTKSYLSLEPGLAFDYLGELPLSFDLGFSLAFPVSKSFESEERLVQPSDASFENGADVRGRSYGDLDLSPVYLGANLGARYRVYEGEKLSISPRIRYTFGLIPVYSELNWKTNYASLGVEAEFKVPRPKAEAPKPPLPPIEPNPPAAVAPELAMIVNADGRELENGDEVRISKKITRYYKTAPVLPSLFYGNEGVSGESADNLYKDLYLADYYEVGSSEEKVIEAIVDYLKARPETDLTILGEGISGEDEKEVDNRIENLLELFEENGIAEDRVTTKKRFFSRDDFSYPELAEESRAIKFVFDGVEIDPEARKYVSEKIEYSAPEIGINTKVESDSKTDLSVRFTAGNFVARDFANKNSISIDLSDSQKKSIFENAPVSARISSKATTPAKASDSKELSFAFVAWNLGSVEKRISEKSKTQKSYVLGRFNFDGTRFVSIDSTALARAREALRSGGKLRIIPSTDDLGESDYNRELADKRAEAALNLIGVSDDQVEITSAERPIFPNSEPVGRSLNRSVIVIIK